MECVDAFIDEGDAFYCLFYEELNPGDHLSQIYHFSGRTEPAVRLVAEIQEWLVSIWVSRQGVLFGAVWDGRILRITPAVEPFAAVDLLGTIKLAGFNGEPRFIMGEDGLIFEGREGRFQRIPLKGKPDIYAVAQRVPETFLFAASGGRVVTYAGGAAAVERLPTNVDLHGICFASADTGYVVGEEGVAFRYDGGAWTDITAGKPTLHDVHCFKGKVLVAVEDESIDEIDGEGEFTQSYASSGYYFSSNDRYCLTFNEEAAHLFDGKAWTSVRFEGLVPL